jgi:hypothetical protein
VFESLSFTRRFHSSRQPGCYHTYSFNNDKRKEATNNFQIFCLNCSITVYAARRDRIAAATWGSIFNPIDDDPLAAVKPYLEHIGQTATVADELLLPAWGV